jgi:hypothetical protein
VGHLHGRGIGVAVYGDDLAAEPLQFDDDLFTEFAGAKKCHTGGRGGKWCAYGSHAPALKGMRALASWFRAGPAA